MTALQLRNGLRLLCCSVVLLVAAANRAVATTESPVALNLNENPFGPSPKVVEALKTNLHSLDRYVGTEAAGLAAQVAELEKVSPDHVVLGEILEVLGQQLAIDAKGEAEFVYSMPGYTALVDAAKPFGGVGVPVPLDKNLGNDLAGIRAAITPRTRAVFLVNPHNPTGVASAKDEFREFVEDISRHAVVIVDEAYLEFTDDFEGRTLVDLTRKGENVIVFRTLAKAYGLAGLPMGYAIAPQPIAKKLRDAGVGFPRSLNRLALVAARAALDDQDFIKHVRDKVAAERALWNTLFADLNVTHTEAAGNFVFFKTGQPHAAFAEQLRKSGVEIGRAFPPYEDWARISIGLPEQNERARRAVTAFLKQ